MPSLDTLNQALGLRKAKHLLRRATFSYTKAQIDTFSSLTPTDAVNMLINAPTQILAEPYDPLPTDAPDGYWTSSGETTFTGEGRKRTFIAGWWWYNNLNQLSLKGKLTFFLHTTFTIAKNQSGKSTVFYDHVRLLEHYALGSIKTLAKKITLDNAMLRYLDNTDNNANNPNENYSREYLELFTILKGAQIGDGDYTNYTETDVQLAAKVFSGFKKQDDRLNIDADTGIPMGYANANKHDSSDKTFSAAFSNQTITGRNDADGMFDELSDFVDMIFSQEETAKAYCRKLYRFFVNRNISSTVETDIISPLATILIANNFEILPVVTTLLTSKHFYDEDDADNTDNIIGATVKNPLQLLSEVCSLFSVSIPDATESTELYNYYNKFFKNFVENSYLSSGGLNLFDPDSVAGYPGVYQLPDYDRQWFTSATIIARYKVVPSLLLGSNLITNGASIIANLDTVSFIENTISTPLNAQVLVTELSELMYPESLSTERLEYFKNVLLNDLEDYYWASLWNGYVNSGDATNAKIRLDELFTAMVNAAEFQLM